MTSLQELGYKFDHKDKFEMVKEQKIIEKISKYAHHSQYGMLQIFGHFLDEIEEMKKVIDQIFDVKQGLTKKQELIKLFNELIKEFADGSNCLDMLSDNAFNLIKQLNEE